MLSQEFSPQGERESTTDRKARFAQAYAGSPNTGRLGVWCRRVRWTSQRYCGAMAGTTIRMSIEELKARMREGGEPTSDDVSVTADGRRLDSKEAVLAWWADFEAERDQRRPDRLRGRTV